MTHSEKVQYLLKDLTSRGVRKYTVTPPLYRLLWNLGWEVRPPLFQGFLTIMFAMGSFMGIFWAFCMWLFDRQSIQLSARIVTVELFFAVIVGVLFGLVMAIYFRWKARKLNLPQWEQYPDV